MTLVGALSTDNVLGILKRQCNDIDGQLTSRFITPTHSPPASRQVETQVSAPDKGAVERLSSFVRGEVHTQRNHSSYEL